VDEGLEKVARELATPAAQAQRAADAMARSRRRENALVQLALSAGTDANAYRSRARSKGAEKPLRGYADSFSPDGGEDQTWL